jgi:hypothetical protein
MKMPLTPVLLVAGLSACADTNAGPTTPIEPAAVVTGGVTGSATGSGHYTSGGELRTLGFSAVAHADGSASGEYQVTIHAIDRFFHVSVTCLVVRNDTAWVAGIIDRTNHPVIVPGTVSYFWMFDDGEGPDAVDEVSTARINDVPGADRQFCTLTPDEAFSGLPGNEIEHGNVQVRSR